MVSCLRLGCGEGGRRRRESDFTRLVRPVTSERSCSISAASCGVARASRCTAEIEGVATSMMSSAICASCVKVGGRQDHSNIGGEFLEEKFANKSFVWRAVAK